MKIQFSFSLFTVRKKQHEDFRFFLPSSEKEDQDEGVL